MKVLVVAMDATPYWDRSHEIKVAEEFCREGHEVFLVAEREPKWTLENPKPVGMAFLGAMPVNDPGQAANIARLLPEASIGFASSVSGAPVLAAWQERTGKPVVAQILDAPMWRLRLRQQGPWWASWQPWYRALLTMDRLIANTEQTKRDLVELAGLYGTPPYPAEKVAVVYYGIDTEIADSVKKPALLPEGAGWLCSVGRLVPYRGVDLAILALSLVPQERRPGLLVVGAGEDQERLMHLGLLAGVTVAFAGGVSDAAKWGLIKACRMGIALQFNPNIPQQAPAEFVYAGKPCITADLPIHRERMLDHGVEYVEPFNTGLIARLIDDESIGPFHARHTEANKQWVRENRSFRSHARGVLKVLEEAAA